MAFKNYYELLEIATTAPSDEVKRAFRLQIARYHPDKVQHLGKEFQAMAADRAAELTEAYRILSDQGRRAEYDRTFVAAGAQTASAGQSAAPAAGRGESSGGPAAPPPPEPPTAAASQVGAQFKQERASRDEFVRKATLGRLRQALEAVGADYDETVLRGFDLACVPGEVYPELVDGGIQEPQDPAADRQGEPAERALRSMLRAPVRLVAGACGDDLGDIIPISEWDEKAPFASGLKTAPRGEETSPGPRTAPLLWAAFEDLLR